MRGPNEKLFKLFTLSDHENAFVKHSFAPRGCSFVSSRLVSFRNRFFLLLLLLLSVCFQFVLQRVTWRTDRERERERGGVEDVQDVPRKVERNKCRRVRCSQECQDICLVKPPVKCFFFPLHKLCKMFKD